MRARVRVRIRARVRMRVRAKVRMRGTESVSKFDRMQMFATEHTKIANSSERCRDHRSSSRVV